MDITGQEYQKMSKKASPPSPVAKNCIKAFLIGGFICALGQLMVEFGTMNGVPLKEARLLSSMALILLSVLLTGFQIYDNIAKHAGAGTLVPITGFANSIVSAAIEFKSEGYVLGLGTKMFIIAGPVLVYGITVSVIYGIIRYLILMF